MPLLCVQVQITAVDELYVEQDAEGCVLKQIARVRLFFLGFLSGKTYFLKLKTITFYFNFILFNHLYGRHAGRGVGRERPAAAGQRGGGAT